MYLYLIFSVRKKYYKGIILTKCNKDQVKFQVRSWKRLIFSHMSEYYKNRD